MSKEFDEFMGNMSEIPTNSNDVREDDLEKVSGIEWLVEKLWSHCEPSLTNKILIEKAKQMELKAKENTYTEEQVREAIEMARRYDIDSKTIRLFEVNEIIQSLKQPKQ